MISASLGCMLCIQIRKGTWERSVAHGNRRASAKKAQARQGPGPRQRKGPPCTPGRDQVCGIFRLKPPQRPSRQVCNSIFCRMQPRSCAYPGNGNGLLHHIPLHIQNIAHWRDTGHTRRHLPGTRPYPGGRCNSPCTPPRTAASRRASRRSDSSGCSSSLRASGASSLRRQPRGTSRERNSHSVLRTWK